LATAKSMSPATRRLYPSLRLIKKRRTIDSTRARRTATKQMILASPPPLLLPRKVLTVDFAEDERSIANKLAREEKVSEERDRLQSNLSDTEGSIKSMTLPALLTFG